jgi:hypothetical protein
MLYNCWSTIYKETMFKSGKFVLWIATAVTEFSLKVEGKICIALHKLTKNYAAVHGA